MVNSVVYHPLELTFVSIYCCFGCLLAAFVVGVVICMILRYDCFVFNCYRFACLRLC